MTEVEQNMAIAECCGWSSVGVNPNLYSGQPFGMFDIKEHPELFDGQPWHTEGTGMGPIPNYVRSLDDMHVAEGFLTENQIRHYNGLLIRMTKAYVEVHYDGVTSSTVEHFKIIHATAAQKAEAFLKVFNKWV